MISCAGSCNVVSYHNIKGTPKQKECCIISGTITSAKCLNLFSGNVLSISLDPELLAGRHRMVQGTNRKTQCFNWKKRQ